MKIIDQNYRFHLQSPLATDWFLDCHLQIFHSPNQAQTVLTKYIVLVTGMGFEMGWFIPNLIEGLVSEVVHKFELDPEHLVWIEHYPLNELQYYQDQNSTGFSLVTFNWAAGKAKQPHWVSITCQTLRHLIGTDLEQLLGENLNPLLEMGKWSRTKGTADLDPLPATVPASVQLTQPTPSPDPFPLIQPVRTIGELNKLFRCLDREYLMVPKIQFEEG
jgi:hypothetical protein